MGHAAAPSCADAAALSRAATAASLGAASAAGAIDGPCPHATNLSLYYNHVKFEPLPAGTFTKVKGLAEAQLGKVIVYSWERTRPVDHSKAPLAEINRAILEVQNAIHINDNDALLQFLRGLPEGGGELRNALRLCKWGGTEFVQPVNLQLLQSELERARESLIAQDTDKAVVGKRMKGCIVRKNVQAEVDDSAMHFYGSRRFPEDAMTEIGVISYLNQQADLPIFLLRMVGVFHGDDDFVTLVTELADSELLPLVQHGLILFPEHRVKRYTWQLLQATGFLHKHHIGHR